MYRPFHTCTCFDSHPSSPHQSSGRKPFKISNHSRFNHLILSPILRLQYSYRKFFRQAEPLPTSTWYAWESIFEPIFQQSRSLSPCRSLPNVTSVVFAHIPQFPRRPAHREFAHSSSEQVYSVSDLVPNSPTWPLTHKLSQTDRERARNLASPEVTGAGRAVVQTTWLRAQKRSLLEE